MDSKQIFAVATAIQTYLISRPESCDTLEGIHSYWVKWSGIPDPVRVTQMALELLESRGVLERSLAGNRTVWRRRR